MDQQHDPITTPVANQIGTAAPGILTLGDKTFLCRQPLEGDMVTFKRLLTDLWRKKYPSPVASVLSELKDVPPEFHQAVIKEAVALKANHEPSKEALVEISFEPEAVAFLAWTLIRGNHPDVTRGEIEALVNASVADGSIDSVIAKVLAASSLKEAAPNSAGGTGS